MPGGVKSRGGRCVSQVWHFTFGSRGEIFLDFEEPFCQKLCGKQYNGDYKSLDLEKGCNKKKKKKKRRRKEEVCRQLLTVWEHFTVLFLRNGTDIMSGGRVRGILKRLL